MKNRQCNVREKKLNGWRQSLEFQEEILWAAETDRCGYSHELSAITVSACRSVVALGVCIAILRGRTSKLVQHCH